MLAIERADVRRFRAVARRAFPTGRPKGPSPPVQITARGGTVTLACHLGEVVVALRATAPKPGKGSLTMSLSDLDAFEGASGVVTLEPTEFGSAMARWDSGPAPRTAKVTAFESHRDWPAEPDRLIAMPPTLPRTLHEVGRSAARDPDQGRYAIGRVQVRGKAGELAGTDGKQALVWGGFTFPFNEDLLVPAVPVFGSKELTGEAAVSVGLEKDWLYLVIGPWQVWLWGDREGRFPDVHGAVPRSCPTRVTFDDRDAADLLRALPDLPGGTGESKPVTLDLGDRVIVRGRDDKTEEVVEVRLAHSVATGPPVRLALGRDHLGRALALGFRELRVSNPERPVTFQDQDRLFLAASLDPSCVVAAAEPAATLPAGAMSKLSSPPILVPVRSDSMPRQDDTPADRNGHAVPPAAGEPFDPVAEAEALRAELSDATARAHRLVTMLKQFKKERRALASAWSSLRQLNLGP
jgi:hypothetical protein